jgi:hypothetical protein
MLYAVILGASAGFALHYAVKVKTSAPVHLFTPLVVGDLLLWLGFLYVILTILTRTVHWWFPLTCLCLTITTMPLGVRLAKEQGALEAAGMRTEGQVSKRIHHLTNHYFNFIYTNTTDSYSLNYTFEADGKIYSSTDVDVTKGTWDNAATNQAIPILYLPQNPNNHEIDLPVEGGSYAMRGLAYCLVALLPLFVGLRIWMRRPRPVATSFAPPKRTPG